VGEKSAIQWTNNTFNPWEGCVKVSPGCKYCYAEARDKRFTGGKHWGPAGVRRRTSPSNWFQPTKWNRDAQRTGIRQRVFCASLADVFEDREELESWRLDLFRLIKATPHLDWQLLTKRPEKVHELIIGAWELSKRSKEGRFEMLDDWLGGRPPENVWLGCTVENQEQAEERIPWLINAPAEVRFLSMEPLLERVVLKKFLEPGLLRQERDIHWVIVGGESGGDPVEGPRPFFVDWARELVAECRRYGVAPFVKQLGGNPAEYVGLDSEEIDLVDGHGGDWDEWPSGLKDLRVREFPR
jgi:protein gp37